MGRLAVEDKSIQAGQVAALDSTEKPILPCLSGLIAAQVMDNANKWEIR